MKGIFSTMNDELKKGTFLRKLIITVIIIGFLPVGIVLFFDPFFHYHKPIGLLKAVLNQEEYQVIGTLRTFDYDSLLVGSSTAENYNNGWFDEAFECTTIKAVKPGANTADLMYFLEEAFKEKEIKNIFYSLDISALTSDKKESFVQEGMPLYLYNKNPLDDVKYLFNKHVIFEDIPYMIACSLMKDYDEGDSFNWAQYKDFSVMYYEPTKELRPIQTEDVYATDIEDNINLLTGLVKTHTETQFRFIIPPYSSLWWYESYMNGELERDFYALEKAFSSLLEYENVTIYYFQDMEEVISNLDVYMDLLHFHPDINRYIVDSLVTGEHRLTQENMYDILNNMQILAQKCIDVYAKEYFDSLANTN